MGSEKKHLSFSSGLNSIDFIPKCVRPDSFLCWPAFKSFSTLIAPANQYLREHPNLQVITCETVHFLVEKDGVKHPENSDYFQVGEDIRPFVKGLRLWLQPQKDGQKVPQQIGYVTFLPKTDTTGHESIKQLTKQVNDWLIQNPLPGKILTIESQVIRGVDGKFNPDSTSWAMVSALTSLQHSFIQCFRIFYTLEQPAYENIGFADFFPATIKQGSFISYPATEQWWKVLKNVNQWLPSLPSNVRLLNMQTLTCRANEKSGKAENVYTAFYSGDDFHKYYLRFLRVAFAVPTREYAAPPPYSVRRLNSRLFVPGLTKEPRWYRNAEFEGQSHVKKRIGAWAKLANIKILAVETVVYKTVSGGERYDGTQAMHTYNETHHDTTTRSEKPDNEQYLRCYRIYTEDSVKDPKGFEHPKTIEEYRRERPEKCSIV